GLGLRTIVWQEDTDDWNVAQVGVDKVKQNYQNIINKAGSESPIVLTHEINNQTMQMFVEMEPQVSQAYKHLVPVSACQNITKPYVEDITYPNYNDFVSGKANYQGLPTVDSIKTNPNAQYEVKKAGFANPSSSSSSSSSSSGSSSSNSNSKSSAVGMLSKDMLATSLISTMVVVATMMVL
ncbi:chitin deacetylase precursor, partial [Malassezia pachydermatis]